MCSGSNFRDCENSPWVSISPELYNTVFGLQISPIRTLKDACDARSGNSCNQMSDSLEEEKDNMGLFQCEFCLFYREFPSLFSRYLHVFSWMF